MAKDEANEVLLVIVGVEVLWSPDKSSSPESRSEEFELAVATVWESPISWSWKGERKRFRRRPNMDFKPTDAKNSYQSDGEYLCAVFVPN